MRRSTLNTIISESINFMTIGNFPLPEFAYWNHEDWQNAGPEYQELIDNMLGWDVTDFGEGDFYKTGLTIFTFRNGNFHQQEKYPKPYCEKLLLVEDGQILPFHYHWNKMEDIINRSGGDLEITLYNCMPEDFKDVEGAASEKQGQFADTPVNVTIDGKQTEVAAGGKVVIKPGQSITLKPGQYHTWQGVPGTGKIMLFEVSACNDDTIDNRFYSAGNRIPEIEEDEEMKYLIFKDYKVIRSPNLNRKEETI